MDKVKKVYVDSRFRTNESASNSDFKFELKEALDLNLLSTYTFLTLSIA